MDSLDVIPESAWPGLGELTFGRDATPSHCSTVMSIAVRNWQLMDGSEKLRSADVLGQFEEMEPQRAGRRAPTDITAALDMHNAPQSSAVPGRSRVSQTLRH